MIRQNIQTWTWTAGVAFAGGTILRPHAIEAWIAFLDDATNTALGEEKSQNSIVCIPGVKRKDEPGESDECEGEREETGNETDCSSECVDRFGCDSHDDGEM